MPNDLQGESIAHDMEFAIADAAAYEVAKMLGKKDIVAVLDEIFEYTAIEGLAIYILEEVHVLKDFEQSPFLEELTRIPDDVYIMMCTTQPYKILPEIRNRAITFNCEVPTMGQCREFIKKICRTAGITIPPDSTIKTLVEVSENTPRKIVSTLQLFSSGDQLTRENLSEFFGLADESIYVDLLEYLHSSKTFYEYAEFVEELSERDISAVKVVKGLDNFMVDVLLARSSRQKFNLIQEGERLSEACSRLGETGILRIMNFIAKRDYSSVRNESAAKYFLLQLKLEFSNSVAGNTNLSTAAAVKLEVNEAVRRAQHEAATETKSKGIAPLDAERLRQSGTKLFFEDD